MALDGSNSKPKYFPAFCKISLLRLLWNSIQPSTAFSGMLLRSEEHTSELQSQSNLVCRLLLEKKNPTADHRSSAAPLADLSVHPAHPAFHPLHLQPRHPPLPAQDRRSGRNARSFRATRTSHRL